MHNTQACLNYRASKEERVKSNTYYISTHHIFPSRPRSIIIIHDFLCGWFSSLGASTKETQRWRGDSFEAKTRSKNLHTRTSTLEHQPHFSLLSFPYLNSNRNSKRNLRYCIHIQGDQAASSDKANIPLKNFCNDTGG